MIKSPPSNTRLQFTLESESSGSNARAATFQTPHGEVKTPIFMPVGTHGALKAMTTAQVLEAGRGKPSDNSNRKDYNFVVDWNADSGIAAEPGQGVVAVAAGGHRFESGQRRVIVRVQGIQFG